MFIYIFIVTQEFVTYMVHFVYEETNAKDVEKRFKSPMALKMEAVCESVWAHSKYW